LRDSYHPWAAPRPTKLVPYVVRSPERRNNITMRLTAPKLAAIAALGLLGPVVVAGLGWLGSHWAIHPVPRPINYMLSQYDFANIAEEVEFPSLDGTSLSGWFIPASETPVSTVVLLHGYGNTRFEMLPHAEFLHRAGHNVLLFDFRGRGSSGGKVVTAGLREPLDVRGAVSYLLTRPEVDAQRIALQGVSMGAAAGIMAMADDPRPAAIVAESAFTDLRSTIERSFGAFVYLPRVCRPATIRITEFRLGGRVDDIQPIKSIARLGERPSLIIDDLDDQLVPDDSGRRLFDAASGLKELWRVEETGHSAAWKTQPDEYRRRVLGFYERHLGGTDERGA
jgi:uncharacterized protein